MEANCQLQTTAYIYPEVRARSAHQARRWFDPREKFLPFSEKHPRWSAHTQLPHQLSNPDATISNVIINEHQQWWFLSHLNDTNKQTKDGFYSVLGDRIMQQFASQKRTTETGSNLCSKYTICMSTCLILCMSTWKTIYIKPVLKKYCTPRIHTNTCLENPAFSHIYHSVVQSRTFRDLLLKLL